jgi:hypothetical protein
VVLHASPSSILYSFGGWKGVEGTSTEPSYSAVVASPAMVSATSSYNLAFLGVMAFAAAFIVAGSLLVYRRRRRQTTYGPWPA